MLKIIQLAAGLMLLLSLEILDVRFDAGANKPSAVNFMLENINYLRLVGFLMIFYPVIYYFKFGNRMAKFAVGCVLLVYMLIAFLYT